MEKTKVSEKQKKMMILGASALQVPAIKKAKELGYQIILVDYDETAVGFELADVKLVVSTLDQEEVYRQALLYQPDVVITSTSDGPVRTAAYVNERLGKRPDLSYENACCATIKSKMRDRLRECSRTIVARPEKLQRLFSLLCKTESNRFAMSVTHIWILMAFALSP